MWAMHSVVCMKSPKQAVKDSKTTSHQTRGASLQKFSSVTATRPTCSTGYTIFILLTWWLEL